MDKDDQDKSINLSASARLIYQLGEQLISDEFVALMELIKNSYDADATRVEVSVDSECETPYGRGRIIINDNGNGMIYSTIKYGFLRLSTNFKKEFKLSPYYKRRVLGDKGIGRLSIQRLGRFINITTAPRIDRLKSFEKEEDNNYLANYNQYNISLDWNLLDTDKDLNSIQAQIECVLNEKPRYGTRIIISGIRNQNFWKFNKKSEKKLRNEIFSMVNPFIKGNNSNFQVYINVNDKKFTNENINENIIDKISDLKISFLLKGWVLEINFDRKYRYANRETNAAISRMRNEEFELVNKRDFNTLKMQYTYTLDFNNMEHIFNDFPYLRGIYLDKVDKDDDEKDKEELAHPGNFKGVLYASDFSTDNRTEFLKLISENYFTDDIKSFDELKIVWDSAAGVYIFRNDFRILPYGKSDWMGFTRKSQTYKSNIFKEHTVAGYINIDGETSENLVEQTNRQGIVEDEYGNNFLRLFREVLLEIIVREDVKFRSGFEIEKTTLKEDKIITKNNLLTFKKVVIDEDTKDGIIEEVTNTIDDTSKNTTSEKDIKTILSKYLNDDLEVANIIKSTDKTIIMMLDALRESLSQGEEIQGNILSLKNKINELKEVDKKIEQKRKQEKFVQNKEIQELRELLPMVGQGIIVESLTHELNRIDQNIKSYAARTKKLLTKRDLDHIDDLIKNQQFIIDETIYLREQLNHLEPTYRKNNKIFQEIDIKQFLRETYFEKGPMSKKAVNHRVSVNITGNTFRVECNRGYLITVFDNLFLNSLYWIDENSENKYINFHIDKEGSILFWDSGPGIHKDIENDLFEAFKSMKKDGRGLGLYIVKELLNSMNAEISLVDERRNGKLFKFKIKFYTTEDINE